MDLSFLEEILRTHGRLILPDFGAFLVSDFENGFSSDKVTFSPFLRYNDGKLEQYLEENYSLSRGAAGQYIAQVVASIQDEINERGHFPIPDLGFLYRNADGTILLQTDPTAEVPTVPTPPPPIETHTTATDTTPTENSTSNSAHAFDIPFIDELPSTAPQPEVEYRIPDSSYFEQKTEPVSVAQPTTPPAAANDSFSLDTSLSSISVTPPVTDPVASTPDQDLLSDLNVGARLVSSTGGYEVNDCLNALEAYQTAQQNNTLTEPEAQQYTTSSPLPEESPLTQILPESIRTQATTTHTTSKPSQSSSEDFSYTIPTPHRRGRKKWFFLTLLLLLLAGLLLDIFYFKEVSVYVVQVLEDEGILLREHSPQQVAIQPEPITTTENTTTVVEQTPAPATETSPSTTTSSTAPTNTETTPTTPTAPQLEKAQGRYYVVLGAFRNLENAERYTERLKGKGYAPIMLPHGTGMHVVSIGPYTTRLEAEHLCNDFLVRNTDAWVLEL